VRSFAKTITTLAFFLAPLFALNATSFMRLSPEQMAANSTLIVRARCIGSIVAVERGEIWTLTSFEPRETWKGIAPPVVRVRLLGGRTRDVTSYVSGVPRFRPGEEVVLFLVPSSAGRFAIVSWAQGTFRVRRDPASGAEVVTRDTAGYGLAPSERAASLFSIVRYTPLEEFHRSIEVALAASPLARAKNGVRP
jgi:hypothetical protein